jgi:hypothetical protein
VVIAIGVLASGHELLAKAENGAVDEIVAIPSTGPPPETLYQGFDTVAAASPSFESTEDGYLPTVAGNHRGRIVVAVDDSSSASDVIDAGIARLTLSPVDLLHIFETRSSRSWPSTSRHQT